jgi:hypothetical protein
VPVALLALAVAAAVAWRRRRCDAVRLCALVALTIPLAWWSLASITGRLADYLVRWTWVIGLMTWLAVAWTMYVVVAPRVGATVRRAALLLAPLIVLAGGVAMTADLWTARPSTYRESPSVPRVTRALLDWRRTSGGAKTMLVQYEGLFPQGEAVLLQLVKAGVPVLTRTMPPDKFGEHRRYRGEEDVTSVFVTGSAARIDALRAAGLPVVAEYDRIGSAGRRRLAAAYVALLGDPDDKAVAALVGRLRDERLAVFLLPGPDVPAPEVPAARDEPAGLTAENP